MAFSINDAAYDSITTPALIASIRKLVVACRSYNLHRPAKYLPDDVVWWARVVSPSGRRGMIFFDQVFNESLDGEGPSAMKYSRAALAKYANLESSDDGLSPRQQMKKHLFHLYARLAIFYISMFGGAFFSFNRRVVIERVATDRQAFVDYERLPIYSKWDDAVAVAVMAHYVSLSGAGEDSERRVKLLDTTFTEFMTAAQYWNDSTYLYEVAPKLITRVGPMPDYAEFEPSRLKAIMKRALPSPADMIADILSYLLFTQKFMKNTFGEYRARMVINFRQKIKQIGAVPSRLMAFFNNGENIANLYAKWSNRTKIEPEVLLQFNIIAIAVIRQIMRQRGTILSYYTHITEDRFSQLKIKNPTFVYPTQVTFNDATAVKIAFLDKKVCYVQKRDLKALPYRLNPDKMLGNGYNGAVFATDDPNVVIKLTDFFTEIEYGMQRKAGELGIGPKTYGIYHIKNAKMIERERTHYVDVSLIVSERMEATLESLMKKANTVEECTKYIDAVMAMLYAVTSVGNFVHHDMKPDNVMLISGGDPTNSKDWRIIDYGLSWYGGSQYDSLAVIPLENSEPYGWNPLTSTLESPTLVYNGWIRTAPPGYIKTWDIFMLLYYVAMFAEAITKKDVTPGVERHAKMMLHRLAGIDPMTYTIHEGTSMKVEIFVVNDLNKYSRVFDVANFYETEWIVSRSYHELDNRQGEVRNRLFVPNDLLDEQSIQFISYIGRNFHADNVYATAVGGNDYTQTKFSVRDDLGVHDVELQVMSFLANVGVPVILDKQAEMPLIQETAYKALTTKTIQVTSIMAEGRSFYDILSEFARSAFLANVREEIRAFINDLFDFVTKFSNAGFIHHSLTIHDIFYDEETGMIYLRNFRDVWYNGKARDIPYHRIYVDRNTTKPNTFTVKREFAMKNPQYSLNVALLFLSLHRDFIFTKLREIDRRLEANIGMYVRTTIYDRFVQVHTDDIERFAFVNDSTIFVKYSYDSFDGSRRQVDL